MEITAFSRLSAKCPNHFRTYPKTNYCNVFQINSVRSSSYILNLLLSFNLVCLNNCRFGKAIVTEYRWIWTWRHYASITSDYVSNSLIINNITSCLWEISCWKDHIIESTSRMMHKFSVKFRLWIKAICDIHICICLKIINLPSAHKLTSIK